MPPRKPARPPLQFLSPIHRATRQIGAHLAATVIPLGLSVDEGHGLSYLLSYAPCPVRDLQRVFGHKPSTLTSMLDRLERGGYIERVPNPDDRRSFLVRLEPKGMRVASRMRADVEPRDVDVFLLMDDPFRVAELAGDVRVLFDHQAAQDVFGASVFWLWPRPLPANPY